MGGRMSVWARVVIGIACVGALMFAGPFVWTPLNCRRESVDIAAGRLMTEQYMLGICVHRRVRETTISRYYVDVFGNLAAPAWRKAQERVGTPPITVYYHYAFAEAWPAILWLDECLAGVRLDSGTKRALLSALLNLLQVGDSAGAKDYAFRVCQAVSGQGSLTLDQVP